MHGLSVADRATQQACQDALRPRSAAVVSSVPLCLIPSGFGETSDPTKYTSHPNTRPLPLTLLFGTRGLPRGVFS
jgi:hypothetical protein